MTPTASERFWVKVNKSGDCWLWTAGTNGAGYGRFWFEGRFVYPHRWAYEQEFGPIASNLVVDHLCRTTACVRPDHLEAVSPAINTLRGRASFNLAGRCIAGLHDVTDPRNVYVRPNGVRQCVRCIRTRRAAYYQQHKTSA